MSARKESLFSLSQLYILLGELALLGKMDHSVMSDE